MPPSLPLAVYANKLVVVSYVANIISGFGKDIFVMGEHEEDAFMLNMGVDGNGVLCANSNESGTVKITLFHTSPSNDVFYAAYAKHKATGIPPGPLIIKDLNGRALLQCAYAWPKKLPGMGRGKETQENEWNLGTNRLDMQPLGN